MYMNSGDWIENLTSLEYQNGKWEIYYHKEVKINKNEEKNEEVDSLNVQKLIQEVTSYK